MLLESPGYLVEDGLDFLDNDLFQTQAREGESDLTATWEKTWSRGECLVVAVNMFLLIRELF